MFPNEDASILNEGEEVRVRRMLSTVLDFSEAPQLSLLKRDNWYAIPVPSSDHFDDASISRIANAIKIRGDNHFYAVALESVDGISSAYRFASTPDGLNEFNNECALFSFAIFSFDFSWLFICTKDDYYIVVGERDFVVRVLGVEMDVAYVHFKSFIESMSQLQRTSDLLVYVHDQLKSKYSEANSGERVKL